jgi:hypothetical protein
MKLFEFQTDKQKYCLTKLDNYNFSIREYLLEQKEIINDGKVLVTEFKAPSVYFGTLEYALKKAFKNLDKQFINKNEYGLFCPTYDSLKSIFELKPYEINESNLSDIREVINKVFNYGS